MSLQAAIEANLPHLRAEAEARMTSTATVKRQSGTTTDADGFEVPAWVTVYADLACRIGGKAQFSGETRQANIGGVEVTLAVRVAHFPHDTVGLSDGDVIEVTGAESSGFLRIVEASWQDQSTARRVPVVEAQEPAGWSV